MDEDLHVTCLAIFRSVKRSEWDHVLQLGIVY